MTPEEELSQDNKCWATSFLIAICAIVYLYSVLHTNIEFISATPSLVWKGEIWRLFSAIFVHANLFHFALDVFILMQIGRALEPSIGGLRILFIFVAAGASGVACCVLTGCEVSGGSTGALFGLLGAACGVMLNLPPSKVEKRLLMTIVLCVLALSLFECYLGVWQHSVGFIVGLGFGFAFVTETPLFQSLDISFKKSRQTTATIVLFGSLLTTLFLIGTSIRPYFLKEYHVAKAFDAIAHHDLETAQTHINWIQDLRRDDSDLYALLARSSAQIGNWTEAKTFANMAISHSELDLNEFFQKYVVATLFVDPRGNKVFCERVAERPQISTLILNDCSWLLLTTADEKVRDPVNALGLILRAVRENQKASPKIYATLAEAYWQNGMKDEAIFALERAKVQGGETSSKDFVHLSRRLSSSH